MTMGNTVKPGLLRTLMQAHDELVRIRPDRKAPLTVWLSYHQQSAAVYEQITKSDPRHESEALYWAARERAHAREIEDRIRVRTPGRF